MPLALHQRGLDYELVTPPAAEPVDVDSVFRQHCRLDADDDSQDAVLQIYVAAARRTAESLTGRSFITQTWRAVADAFPMPCDPQDILFLYGPVKSIGSIRYLDTSGVQQLLDPSKYVLVTAGKRQRVAPTSGNCWPTCLSQIGAVSIEFTAGYGNTGADVPAPLRNWILVRAATAYEHREEEELAARGTVLKPSYVDSLLDVEGVGTL